MGVKMSNVQEVNDRVSDILMEYQKRPNLCRGISNVRCVATHFDWWDDLGKGSVFKDVIVELAKTKLDCEKV